MSTTTYAGIDYGQGRSNIDKDTGIRFGVIAQGSIDPEAFNDVWLNARNLTHEAAIQDFKLAISRVEDTHDLSELLDERLHYHISAPKWACEIMADYIDPETDGELALGTRTTSEFVEHVWAEVEDTFNDQYDDCGERDWLYESGGYKLTSCLTSDVFVLASPYFTYAQFCSPCVPGGCNLDSPLDATTLTDDVNPSNVTDPAWARQSHPNKAYCLGHDYFDGGTAPYPVYSVETGELVSAK